MSMADEYVQVAGPSRLQQILAFEVGPQKIKSTELMHFCRYMSVFMTAGVPVLDALEVIRADTKDKRLQRLIVETSAALRSGDNLSTALAAHHRALPNFFVHMIRAGEESGQVAPVLGQLSAYIERDVEAKRKTRSALTYPVIVIALAIVSVAILVGFVLPRFVDFFDSFDAELPWTTRALVATSEALADYGPWAALALFFLGLILAACTIAEEGKLARDRLILKLPLVSKVVLFGAVERFCRVLTSMVQAGVPLPVALDLASQSTSNRDFRLRMSNARQEMITGGGLSGPLAGTGLLPPAAVQMLRVGEETGTLEHRLDEVSVFYGKELEYRLKKMTDMLEPAAVIIVGALVGFVSIAIISAIYGVYQSTDLKQ